MIGRAEIEQAIIDEEAALGAVARLLESETALDAWSDDLRTALGLALTDPTMSRAENWKAVTLRRHLFGPTADVPATLERPPSEAVDDVRRAQRLRGDLTAIVKYRAGAYLLGQP